MRRSACLVACLAVALASCSERERPLPRATRDPQPPRVVINPPIGTVRPLPPHAIRSDGVGPYKLGDTVASLLQQLPSGPRIVRFEIPGIVRTSMIRAENDTVLVGGDPASTATFVAVIGSEVARTEAGVHVGSTVRELVDALGPLAEDVERAHDPRIAVPSKLRNVRAILDGTRIAAFVVAEVPTPRERVAPAACERPKAVEGKLAACFTAAGEYVETGDDEIVVRSVEGDRTLASIRMPNLLFAAPLRNVAEGRDELIAITRTEDEQQQSWSIVGYRFEGGRFTRAVDLELIYRLTSAQSRWVGIDVNDVDLYLELTSRANGIEVGGLLTTRRGGSIRDVSTISPVVVTRRQGRTPPPTDAGVPDALVVPSRGDAGVDSANP